MEITPEVIEVARKHCHMTAGRVKEMQGPDYIRFWDYMYDRRKRRIQYFRETGEVPRQGWTPPKKGEPDRSNAVVAMGLHRQCVAKMKKKIQAGSTVYDDRITQHFEKARRLNGPAKVNAYNEVLAMIHLHTKLATGKPLNIHEMLFLDEKLGTGLKRARRAKRKAKQERKAKGGEGTEPSEGEARTG
jgi:hypothetical protein